MKTMTKLLTVVLTFAISVSMFCSCKAEAPKTPDTGNTKLYQTPMEALGLSPEDSPEWVVQLAESKGATKQIFVIAAHEKTTAWVSLHEKDASGKWKMIMTTPGYIGLNGLGKTKEGDGMTPVGTFTFNRAFGIADDPGCAIPYVKADDDTYWSGDTADGMHYNELVSLKDLPNLNKDDSEHITDYVYEYQYCLNISYNDSGTPGAGSAIFLHCLGNRKPRTGGCVAIPMEQMYFVMQHVSPDCMVVIDSMDNLGASF
ncbi:L,D-transpeptidase family protein [Butyrivibrio sp. AE2032]|uniref:L,D-transpeptidase family protein n=1 Tax=Butyrivibrio sp. AE2032 TaxID=1458463 RepID=UPI00069048B2|nr:L,D-transpeptidase family protein [Butyrivibrio sp. AE2032]